jgi:predicted Zn-dependent protease
VGLFSFFTPSPEKRVARARKMLVDGRAEFARLEVLDLDHPEAAEVLVAAEIVLARRNLEAALRYGSQHEDERAAECLRLAESFHHGALDAELQDTRRELRELRAHRDQAEERRRAERDARLMAVDPLGLTGGPSWLDPVLDPAVFGLDQEELQARLALVVENYPRELRDRVYDLGVDFAQAVLALDEGRASEAMTALLALPSDEPLVWWERARAAHALGDPAETARALREFVRLAGRHYAVGAMHSGEFLARALAEAGDAAGGLRVLREVRATEPKVGGFLYAQLLAVAGERAEAEQVLVGLVRQHPTESALYVALARLRIAGDQRPAALRALETGLQACCGSPGRCGTRPPDLETHRLLATLYLEDGADLPRGLDLAEQAAQLVERPSWDDVYLRALAARRRGDADAAALAARLREVTPPELQPRVDRYLAS